MKETDKTHDEELKDAPALKSMAGKNFFSVPDNYFNGFSASVVDRIAAEKEKQSAWSYIFSKPVKRILIPVFSLTIILIAFFIYSNHKAEKKFVALNYDAAYTAGIVNDIDINLISEYYTEKDTTNNEIENYILDSSTEDNLINEL
jgi:hypothetical protein